MLQHMHCDNQHQPLLPNYDQKTQVHNVIYSDFLCLIFKFATSIVPSQFDIKSINVFVKEFLSMLYNVLFSG